MKTKMLLFSALITGCFYFVGCAQQRLFSEKLTYNVTKVNVSSGSRTPDVLKMEANGNDLYIYSNGKQAAHFQVMKSRPGGTPPVPPGGTPPPPPPPCLPGRCRDLFIFNFEEILRLSIDGYKYPLDLKVIKMSPEIATAIKNSPEQKLAFTAEAAVNK